MFDLKLTKYVYLQPIEVVDHVSETQTPVAENLNKLTEQDKGYIFYQVVSLYHNPPIWRN